MKYSTFLSTAAVCATAYLQPLEARTHGDNRGASMMVRSGAQETRTVGSPRPQQTIAFGGTNQRSNNRVATVQASPRADRNIGVAESRHFGGRTQFSRNDFRSFRPSADVFRSWDRGRVHTWNNHSYRWYNNDWVIIDGGYDPDYYGYVSTPEYYTSPVPDVASSDDLAVEVQEELSRRGYDPGAIDGVIGPQTRDAIAAFQEDHKLPVTGHIDRSLLRAMGL